MYGYSINGSLEAGLLEIARRLLFARAVVKARRKGRGRYVPRKELLGSIVLPVSSKNKIWLVPKTIQFKRRTRWNN